MSDPRIESLREALHRFTERLSWIRPFQGPEEPATLEEVRSIMDEWALLEPHLELLEAVAGRERLAPLVQRVEELRARKRMAFLLAVGRLLHVTQLLWTNEMLMRLPGLLKKLPPEVAQSAEMTEQLAGLRAVMKEWPEPEQMFRESMKAADNCEPVVTQLQEQLLKDWPEEWTDAMQTRLEQLEPDQALAWRAELAAEAAELEKIHPGVMIGL